MLLKTAIATVPSAGHVQTEANILFDEGAEKLFITEHLAEELKLMREGTETIYLSSFGSTSNKVQQADVVTVYVIVDNRQQIPGRVLIVATISTPINNRLQHAVSELPYLRGLKLAHPGNGDYTFTIYADRCRLLLGHRRRPYRSRQWTSRCEVKDRLPVIWTGT